MSNLAIFFNLYVEISNLQMGFHKKSVLHGVF